MNKLTLDHLALSREIALMVEQGNIQQASKHYNQRRDKAEQALAFLDSMENRSSCLSCLLQSAIQALVNMTLPDNADSEDRKAQNYLVMAYVIQQATARHGTSPSSQQTLDGELLHGINYCCWEGSPLINYIRIQKFCELTGWSKSWVDRRIGGKDDLKWVAGREYYQLPNGRIVISIKGYEEWVEKGQASGSSAKAPSKSVLPIRENAVAKGSSSSPPPLI